MSDLRRCWSHWWTAVPSWSVPSACISSCVMWKMRRCGLLRNCRRRSRQRTVTHCWVFKCYRRRTSHCRMRLTVMSHESSASSTSVFQWLRKVTRSQTSSRSSLMSWTLCGLNSWQLCRLAKTASSSQSLHNRSVAFWILISILASTFTVHNHWVS